MTVRRADDLVTEADVRSIADEAMRTHIPNLLRSLASQLEWLATQRSSVALGRSAGLKDAAGFLRDVADQQAADGS